MDPLGDVGIKVWVLGCRFQEPVGGKQVRSACVRIAAAGSLKVAEQNFSDGLESHQSSRAQN